MVTKRTASGWGGTLPSQGLVQEPFVFPQVGVCPVSFCVGLQVSGLSPVVWKCLRGFRGARAVGVRTCPFPHWLLCGGGRESEGKQRRQLAWKLSYFSPPPSLTYKVSSFLVWFCEHKAHPQAPDNTGSRLSVQRKLHFQILAVRQEPSSPCWRSLTTDRRC